MDQPAEPNSRAHYDPETGEQLFPYIHIPKALRHFPYPQPDTEGIAGIKEVHRTDYGTELTDEQAHDILSWIMRFLWVLNLPSDEDEQVPEQG